MTGLLTIGFAGDVMLGRTLDSVIARRGYDHPWGNMLPLLKRTDMNIINLETTLTNSNTKIYKAFNFKASPDKVQSLLNANVSIANLANNHILDFADSGLLETIQTLDTAGILHVGAGKNIAKAIEPVVTSRKGIRIGCIGLTDNEPCWKANLNPGTNYIETGDSGDRARVLQSIEELRKETDLLIISIHWGPNMRQKPTPCFVDFAHAMVESGADLIHGHSAHIFQGIERYNDSLILYDTGDFIDDYVVDPELRNDLSAFYILKADRSGIIELEIVPVRIFQYQVNYALYADYTWVLRRMQQLSEAFNTSIEAYGRICFGKQG